ncbi:MAG: glycosyl hydrolase family 95 catalytic domain-containing protein, partial [Bacteroides sp.]
MNTKVLTQVAAYALLFLITVSSCDQGRLQVIPSKSDLSFNSLAHTWDEGIPLGNALIGSLVWQKGEHLRFSLDRTDLWDLRPSDSIAGANNRFSWVYEQVKKGDYLPVQKKFDHPYSQSAAPSKIPGAALEFDLSSMGCPTDVRLFLNNALCELSWENGTQLQTFVHATEPVGWFVFDNLEEDIEIQLIAPTYSATGPVKDL